jgi:tetratricopeptide (TPR) repeat protein
VEALEHLVRHAPPELLDRHISQYGDSIARLVPALRAVSEEAEASESGRYVLFRAIEGLLGEVAQEGPVLVVLEDLHWADLPTLKLLRRLLTSPRSLALMLVCTCRVNGAGEQDELKGLLADAHREPGIQRLELGGLDDVDVAELVGGMDETPAGDPDDRLAAELRATTDGNPFFVTELVRSLVASEALTAEGDGLHLGHGVDPAERLPVSIRETLARRAGHRGDSVRRCLEVAAVIGEEFQLDLVTDVVGDEAASAAMQLAIQDALIIELPGRRPQFRFTHTLMRRYLYGELGRLRQTELHRQIASAMERRMETGDRAVAALAQQWVQAGDADTHRALRYSILAGDDALQKLAPDEARRWYDGSLELLRQDQQASAARRGQLLIKRGEAERQAGDQRFRLTLLEAAEIAQQTGDQDMLVQAALANTRGMQSETGVVDRGRLAVLDAALDVVGEGDGPERARLLATKGAELMYSGEWQARVRLSDEALAIARRLDDPDALITVLNLRFVTLLAPETLAERQANTEEAVTIAERQRDPLVRFYAYHWRAYACIEAGDGLAARSWMTREQDIADRFRQPTTLWLNRADQANLAIIAGQLTRATELAMEALELGQHSEPDALACFAAQQAAISFEHGGLGELVPMLEQAVSENPGVPGFRATLALALIQASRLQEARELIDRAADAEFAHLPYDVTWLTVSCIYALAASALEHVLGARVLYRMLEPWSDQVAFPAFGVWGPVSLHLGSLSITIGELDIAERHLRAAARAAIRAGAPRWEAHANRRLTHLSEMSR